MTSTTVLRTPPTSTSYRSDCLPLRPIRGDREKDVQHGNSPSPAPFCRFKSLSEDSSYSSSSQPSPSPLRKRVLFERGSNGQCDSDDDDETSPSFNGLHSPFMSRCASPFLGAWAKHCPKRLPSNQLTDDGEGIFLTSKTTTTPHPVAPPNPGCTVNYQKLATGTSGVAKPALTPPATEQHSILFLSPLHQRKLRITQTPAETDWYLGEQAKSMTRLSLGEENRIGRYKGKNKNANISNEEQNSSPSPIYRRRGCKRSFGGDELPSVRRDSNKRPEHGISIFHTPTVNSSITELGGSPTALFSRRILSPPPPSITASLLSITKPAGASVTRSSASSPKIVSEPIAKKYRPRDSGVGGLDDDEEAEDTPYPLASKMDTEPQSLDESDSGFITPGFEPSSRSAWPGVALPECQPGGVDEFIMKTLAAGSVTIKDKKIMPETPVKRNVYVHSRPWMSSSKAMAQPALPRAGVPRKSLPLSFPNLSQIQNSPDGSDISPSDRSFVHRKPYSDVGKGRPGVMLSRGSGYPADAQAHSLMRRSSSGAFSSSSSSEGSLLGTPTKPITPVSGIQPSISQTKTSSTKRPIYTRPHTFEQGCRLTPRPSFGVLSRRLTEHERPGKFETDFITINSLGTGEFGNVLKVRYKRSKEEHIFAVKKSKSFEGDKHRRRLREEVDVLQHLSLMGGSSGHPNVLKYVDSWEQDRMLYIQTELCELGNFGNFLAEYGAHFAALDEACVWKVCAELSNGLKFIHDAGVIHLDLKPANIFITCEGRFRIGDFGMASLWPRRIEDDDFEREGDREYMAPEVLQGRYGKAADIFSFGMIMLETAANIVVPDMGSDWHRLRQDDFSAVDFTASDEGSAPCLRSPELVGLIVQMMRSDPDARLTIEQVFTHAVVRRAREAMERKLVNILADGLHVFAASPLGGEPETFVNEVLQIRRLQSP